jgi:hypothetical protein
METPIPTVEDTKRYEEAKTILGADCILVVQIYPNSKTISDYEERFNIPEEERFKSPYISRKLRDNDDRCSYLSKRLCDLPVSLPPLLVELVPLEPEKEETSKQY